MYESRMESVECQSGSGIHNQVWHEWGNPNSSHAIICAHALDRVGHDFKALAEALQDDYRIVAIDFPGRGYSDKLTDHQDYNHETYLSNIVTMIKALGVESIDWIGTSLGGIVGLRYADLKDIPIRKLILNDIGTEVSGQVLKQAGITMGKAIRFRDMRQAQLMFKVMTAESGPLSDEQWQAVTEPMLREHSEGGYQLHFDINISENFKLMNENDDLDLWPYYERFNGKVMIIRGENSKVLTAKNFLEMQQRKNDTIGLEVLQTGHAPMLVKNNEVAAIKKFLEG
jgi:pimeloyl-ACP methyl ester carboxylesterase